MKKCEKCGAIQRKGRSVCVDCGALLGRAVSETEKEQTEEAISSKLSSMSERSEDFYVSPLSRILGIVSILAALLLMITVHVAAKQLDLIRADLPEYAVIASGGAGTVYFGTGSDGSMTQISSSAFACGEALETGIHYALGGLFCFITAALFFLIPKIMWYLDTMRFRLWYDCAPSPSYLSLLVDKIIKYGCFAAGCFLLAAAAVHIL